MIPVDHGKPASVVRKIEPADSRYVRETSASRVKETAIPLTSAEAVAFADKLRSRFQLRR